MKWMCWSWEDFCEAPPLYVEQIVKMINEEAAEIEKVLNRNRG